MSAQKKHQGVISGVVDFNNTEYVEIFDKDYKYLYGEIDDLFVAYGTWVEYYVTEAPRIHPKNCKNFARDVKYVDVKCSKAPTSDEFRSNDMNVRDYNKVDFFQYDNSDGTLTHKSTIQRDFHRHNQYYNNYYGDVIISQDAHRRLIEHRIDKLDVMMNLIPSKTYSGGPHWEVIHFINQGKCYSINGYLSITGHVLRGPGGVVRNRSEVTVAPDALRPKNLGRTFGNSPAGTTGLGGLARTPFGSTSSAGSGTTSGSSGPSGTAGFGNRNSNEGYGKKDSQDFGKNESEDPFNCTIDDTVAQTTRMSLDSTFGKGFGSSGKGFGSGGGSGFGGGGGGFGRNSGKPKGLGRLSNAHF